MSPNEYRFIGRTYQWIQSAPTFAFGRWRLLQAMCAERSSSGDSSRRLLALETTAVAASEKRFVFFGPGRHPRDKLPTRKSVSRGLQVRPSTATSLGGCWCDVQGKMVGRSGPCHRAGRGTGEAGRPTGGRLDAARGRPPAGALVSGSRRFFDTKSASAGHRASLARKVASLAREADSAVSFKTLGFGFGEHDRP